MLIIFQVRQGRVKVCTSLIRKTLGEFRREPEFISAHGTATLYNDEMEAIAISRAGISHVPVNSMKGYWDIPWAQQV
jgi:3-oxoacyl-(acyl-carrier-protein) synthase